MLREATPLTILAIAWTLVAAPGAAHARVVEIFPSNADISCNEEFENVANTLKPGDELVLHGGIYTQTCRRALTANGTAAQPITIRAATGERPILTRPAVPNLDYPQNNLDIENSSYLVIRGLVFRGGSSGLTVSGLHITLEDNELSETSNNAIAMNRGNTDSFVIGHNHIHHTGLLDLAAGTTEGEGLYIGCNNNSCTASNHLIEGNYIHDLRATSGGGNEGIEVKVGSYDNIFALPDQRLQASRRPCGHAPELAVSMIGRTGEARGLMSFGPSHPVAYPRGAVYVDKILRGAKPGDLPVE